MAKQPEAIDRFRIVAEASAAEMGPLLAQLTRMGLQNIGYELITDVRRFQTNGSRRHDVFGDEFALGFIKEHPTFKAAELVAYFEAAGRHKSGAYTAAKLYCENGTLVKLGAGNYRRADVKALPGPEEAKRTRVSPAPKYEGATNETLVRKAIRGRKKITVIAIGKMLSEAGRNGKSASPIISKLAKAKLLKLIQPGEYEVVKQQPGETNG